MTSHKKYLKFCATANLRKNDKSETSVQSSVWNISAKLSWTQHDQLEIGERNCILGNVWMWFVVAQNSHSYRTQSEYYPTLRNRIISGWSACVPKKKWCAQVHDREDRSAYYQEPYSMSYYTLRDIWCRFPPRAGGSVTIQTI